MVKTLQWMVIVGILTLLTTCLVASDRRKPSRWAMRVSPGTGWHLESGYLVTFVRGGSDYGFYLSGKWYRFGPVALQQTWATRIAVTNPVTPTTIRRIF